MDDDARPHDLTPMTPAHGSTGRSGRALDRARKSRARLRRLLVRTTLVTGLGFAGFCVLFGLRCSRPSSTVVMEGGAPHGDDAAEAAVPIVTLRAGRVMLDGVEVGTTFVIAESGRMQRLDGLFEALKSRRIERDLRERSVVLDVAADVPAIVVKSAVQTAAFAGYTDVSFIVGDARAP